MGSYFSDFLAQRALASSRSSLVRGGGGLDFGLAPRGSSAGFRGLDFGLAPRGSTVGFRGFRASGSAFSPEPAWAGSGFEGAELAKAESLSFLSLSLEIKLQEAVQMKPKYGALK